uniref:uncharacterized protein LOC122587556 n=1 Tax=Erigeron canadensis TaxID=72917 RepID=UPI001CB96C27|nr:uncharacterized protein LOC122587556 [Erigeron canadensis]
MSSSYSPNEIILPPMFPDLSTGSSFLFFQDALVAAEELEDSGSSSDTRTYIERHREEAHEKLMRDHFVEPPKFGERFFRHHYRKSKRLLLKIVDDIEAQYPYFQQHTDARNGQGFSQIQKCTSAIKQLSTGEPSDNFDEYLCMADRTSRECLINFCDSLSLYDLVRNGTAPDSSFIVRGRYYKRGYLLTDGIYPSWSTFVKAYPHPVDPKEKKFKRVQEAARKDIERVFGVLKGK